MSRKQRLHGKRMPVRFTGQHFTIDQQLISQLISHTQIKEGDYIYDLGAGKGALIKPLANKPVRIIAIEKDERLVQILSQHFRQHPHITVKHADLLDIRFPAKPFGVICSLPYNITTGMFRKLLSDPSNGFTNGAFIIQFGAARRFTAPRSAHPEIILWNALYNLRIIRQVGPASFSPPPRVASALLSITRYTGERLPDPFRFYAFISRCLLHKNLPVKVVLAPFIPRSALLKLCQEEQIRPGEPVSLISNRGWVSTYKASLAYRSQPLQKLTPKAPPCMR